MEEEVREILRSAALAAELDHTEKLGTGLVERFAGCDFEGVEIEEKRGQPARPADLDP